MVRKLKKDIIVEYIQNNILIKKVHYFQDGTSETEGVSNQNEFIIQNIIESVKIYEHNLPKLKFVQLAIQCLEDKSNIDKLQNVIDGMLL